MVTHKFKSLIFTSFKHDFCLKYTYFFKEYTKNRHFESIALAMHLPYGFTKNLKGIPFLFLVRENSMKDVFKGLTRLKETIRFNDEFLHHILINFDIKNSNIQLDL